LWDEVALLHETCRIIVDHGGHRFAWIGTAEHDPGKTVMPVIHHGFEESYLDRVNITWADTERGRGPAGIAIRTGKPAICRYILTDPGFAPWRSEAKKRGYASAISLPLIVSGDVLGALNIYAAKPNAFDKEEVSLLTTLAADLSHGIEVIRTRSQKEQAEEARRVSEKRYRELAANLQLKIEEERTRIARELHDELGQDLTILRLDLTGLRNESKREGRAQMARTAFAKIEAAIELTDSIIKKSRSLATRLRPVILDQFGLIAGIEWLADNCQKHSGIKCRISDLPENVAADAAIVTALFRICQEIITNVIRHAEATELKISLTERAGELLLTIQDNGRGITNEELANQMSLGILGMQERAKLLGGNLVILGREGEGTMVSITMPSKESEID
jgi:signal transduction histidine kinase